MYTLQLPADAHWATLSGGIVKYFLRGIVLAILLKPSYIDQYSKASRSRYNDSELRELLDIDGWRGDMPRVVFVLLSL